MNGNGHSVPEAKVNGRSGTPKTHFIIRRPIQKRVLLVFGTRPEAIKMAPVVKELQRFPQRFRPLVCVTAQHRELLDEVLRAFQIKVDYDLNIMTASQTLEEITVKVLKGIARVCEEARPSVVLVQGDTTTTLAAALAAFYCGIPVGHVEAGLRTYDRENPYPEEMNRRLTSHLADYHYAPTPAARENLLREGIPRTRILVTGNTIVDALQWMLKRLRPASGRLKGLRQVDWKRDRIVLVTAHRRESWGRPLERICAALRSMLKLDDGIHVVFPVHPNPAVTGTVHRLLDGMARVHLLPPPFLPGLPRAFESKRSGNHGFRRYSRGGGEPWKASRGDARNDRTARGHSGRAWRAGGHGNESDSGCRKNGAFQA